MDFIDSAASKDDLRGSFEFSVHDLQTCTICAPLVPLYSILPSGEKNCYQEIRYHH